MDQDDQAVDTRRMKLRIDSQMFNLSAAFVMIWLSLVLFISGHLTRTTYFNETPYATARL